MISQAIPSRPKTSGTRSLRTVCRPCRRASTSTSAAVAGSIGRSAGGGPWRSVSIMLPPGLITETSLRNARARALAGTCIHTALTQIRSKVSFRAQNLFQRGQGVVHPTDVGGRVECLPHGAHFCRRLGRDDLVAVGGEPGSIPSGAGAHVEHAGALIRQQVEHRCVNFLEREAFISGRQRGRSGVVAGHYVADGEVVLVWVAVAVVVGDGVHACQNVARYWEAASRT